MVARDYRVRRMVNITPPNGAESVFFEVWEVLLVEGEERFHRNAEVAFATEEEALEWIQKSG